MKIRTNGVLTVQALEQRAVVMYDLDLNVLFFTSINHPATQVQKLISLSPTDCLLFTRNSDMVVLNTEACLESVRSGSIFNLKSEDVRDLILIKSKENFFFTIDSQKMEFYSVSTFKKSE